MDGHKLRGNYECPLSQGECCGLVSKTDASEAANEGDAAADARQHLLPAGLIGQFSDGSQKRLRNRKVFVRRRSGGQAVARSANRLAWQAEYYGRNTPAVGHLNVDPVWGGTESELPDAIEALSAAKITGAVSLRLWLWVLVPFAASLFARGIDFEAQFDERMRQLLSEPRYDEVFPSGESRRTNTNQARLIEVVRLLAPVMKASWRIMHNATPNPLVLNDRGFSLYHASATEPFYGLPLNPRLMLLLRAGLPSPTAGFETRRVTGIEHREMSPQDVESANRGTFELALREVYGPTIGCLEALGQWAPDHRAERLQMIGSDALIEPGFDLRFHEADWFAATGQFRAKQNYLPRDTGFPVLIRMDLPMLPAQAYGLSQRTLELAELTLHEGRGEIALEHCAAVADQDQGAVKEWLGVRLKVPRFGRRHGKDVAEVAQTSRNLLESSSANAHEVCAAAMRLALIEAGEGRSKEARLMLERAAVTSKDYFMARIRAALLMEAYGDREGAVEAFQGVAKDPGPHLSEAACRLGELLVEENAHAAEQWFQGAINAGDTEWSARALFRLATLQRERSDRLAAFESYGRAESIGKGYWSAAAAYNHGVYRMELGDGAAAIRLWRRGFATTDPYWRAQCAFALGGHLFSHNEFAQAKPFLEFAAKSRLPEIKDRAALNLGMVLLLTDEPEHARYWLEQVIAEARDDLPMRARLGLADLAQRRGDHATAIGFLQLVASGNSEELAAQALLRWGRILEEATNGTAAARLYERVVELQQAGPTQMAALQLAMLVRDGGDAKRAMDLARLAGTSPDDGVAGKAANLAGICSLELGDAENAISWFRQATKSLDHRQSVIGQANLGGMLVDVDKVSEGIDMLREAKGRGGPGAVLAGMNLAEYWSKKGQVLQAERAYRWAMSAQGGRYRAQATVPYAQFLGSLGRIREARQAINDVLASAGPKQRRQLEAAAAQVGDASEGVALELRIDSPVYIEDEDEKRPTKETASQRHRHRGRVRGHQRRR
jgi:tetratricopeptide (TPR) repeat protein